MDNVNPRYPKVPSGTWVRIGHHCGERASPASPLLSGGGARCSELRFSPPNTKSYRYLLTAYSHHTIFYILGQVPLLFTNIIYNSPRSTEHRASNELQL